MQIEHICTLKGHIPLLKDDNILLSIKNRKIYSLSFNNLKTEEVARLPASGGIRMLSMSRLLKRLFRLNVYCGIKIDDNHSLISDKGIIYCVNLSCGKVVLDKSNPPSIKPLSFCNINGIRGFDNMICYGEYVRNSAKSPIKIMGRDTAGEWKCLHIFPAGEVGHVHSLAPDPYRHCVWIFTGDYGNAAGIWCATDNFKHVGCLLRGKQQYRASGGYPVAEGIIYATDSHLERNSIRILKIGNNSVKNEKLYDLNGSCIYSMKLGEKFFFSTTIEPGQPTGRFFHDLIDTKPGPGILNNYCDVIAGNTEVGFEHMLKWKADRWPKRPFQFSSIIFPMTTSSNNYLPLYGQGCIGHDDCTEIFRLNS